MQRCSPRRRVSCSLHLLSSGSKTLRKDAALRSQRIRNDTMKLGLTRRQVLTGVALAAAAGGASRLSALEGVAMGPRNGETGGDTLVVIFLRGGADGLNIVVPYGDADYYRLR